MTEDEQAVRDMLTGTPTTDRAVVIFPVGDQAGCHWLGWTPAQVAELLYRVADQIVEHRLPRLPVKDPGKKGG